MNFKWWKSLILTAVIMGLLIWLYVLADTYLYAVAEIYTGVLVVAGFIFIGMFVFVVIYSEPVKRNLPAWEQECRRARK